MTLEFLIATMNRKGIRFLDHMFLHNDIDVILLVWSD